MIQAAVVTTWGQPPTYRDLDIPPPSPTQVRIKVLAAGLHALVRSRASGQHYTTAGTSPPHVPGADGVGTVIPTGELVYFNSLTSATGSFASEINVERENVFALPEGADPDAIALLANGVISSWMALTARAGIAPGQASRFSVAVVGATGVSGQAAVQIAKAMGAERIVAVGKPGAKLEKTRELGATHVVAFEEKSEETDFGEAADVDVVLDYLWGDVAKVVLPGIVAKRKNKSQRLTWVEIGALGGDDLPVSGALLRKANVAIVGCGPGSWTYTELGAQLPAMLRCMVENQLKGEYKVEKLEHVESWWNETAGPRKLVKP
ncbi:Protein indc11-like protein 2 [Stagonosporopsis vannaccii]|nr:Protein indc11-like protein 2 [Stagonosporopsis vannaccii]